MRLLFLALIRLFYPRMALTGRQHLPAEGPVIVVANHPNGLLDPVLLRAALGRPVAFLAKSTLFGNPLGRAAMGAFQAIPVYRAHESDTSKNELTFARCRELLAARGWLALFPEGTSHSDPALRPLKTGAARIALSAGRPVAVVPVGLLYEDKGTFRSAVTVAVGPPFTVEPPTAEAPGEESGERAAVADLTARIALALSAVVLEASDRETQRALLAVAGWTQPDAAAARDPGAVASRARRLATAWRRLVAENPDRAEVLVDSFRKFERLVREVGLADPYDWEGPSAPTARRFLLGLAPLALLWPLALLGAALAWLPYRLVRPLATKLAGGETDLVGTLKLLLGLVVLLLTYAGWTVAAGLLLGPAAALGALVVGPASGYVALRYGERLGRRREMLHALWLRATTAGVGDAVARARRDLTDEVNRTLRELEG